LSDVCLYFPALPLPGSALVGAARISHPTMGHAQLEKGSTWQRLTVAPFPPETGLLKPPAPAVINVEDLYNRTRDLIW
jgi:hypothetical protein